MDYEDPTITLLKHTLHRLRHLYETQSLKPGKVLEIGLKPQWNVVIGSSGQCGMAINFTGIHSLHETPEPDLEKLIRSTDIVTVVAILNQGRLAHQGEAEKVITEKTLRETYGVNVKILYVGDGVDRKVCLFPSLQNTRLP